MEPTQRASALLDLPRKRSSQLKKPTIIKRDVDPLAQEQRDLNVELARKGGLDQPDDSNESKCLLVKLDQFDISRDVNVFTALYSFFTLEGGSVSGSKTS